MSKRILHTAIYRGKEYTTHTRGFMALLGRSAKFVYTYLKEADALNKENGMQYVVDVCEFKASEKKNKVKLKRALTRIPSTDSNRMRREERFIKGHESLMGNFLYPCNIDLIAKREG